MNLKALSVIALLSVPSATQAQQAGDCLPSNEAMGEYLSSFLEFRVGQGLSSQGTIIQIWANHDTGTWTLTETDPSGITCLLGFGGNYETIHEGPTY